MRHHPTAIPSAWPIAGGHIGVALVVGTLAHAGVARHVTGLARALGTGRHRVHLYVLSDAGEPAVRLRGLGIPATLLPRRHSYEPARMLALARAFKRDGIDVVHAILPAGAAYGALAARLAGVPIVVSSRAGDPREDRHVRSVLRRLYRGATLVLANTRAQARLVAEETGIAVERVPVVYDGADLAAASMPGVLEGLRDRVWHRRPLIGGAGSPATGRALFYAAAGRIAARRPDVQFVWLAEGNDVGAGELPSDLPVTIVPAGDDALPVLSELALLCLTDGPECPSIGLASAAMAAGRPVVAGLVPGIDELVEDGTTGAVVPSADAEALAEAALGLLEDRGRLRTLGYAARSRAEQVLGVEGMARATAALYEASLLGAIGGPAGAVSR